MNLNYFNKEIDNKSNQKILEIKIIELNKWELKDCQKHSMVFL